MSENYKKVVVYTILILMLSRVTTQISEGGINILVYIIYFVILLFAAILMIYSLYDFIRFKDNKYLKGSFFIATTLICIWKITPYEIDKIFYGEPIYVGYCKNERDGFGIVIFNDQHVFAITSPHNYPSRKYGKWRITENRFEIFLDQDDIKYNVTIDIVGRVVLSDNDSSSHDHIMNSSSDKLLKIINSI